jgi:putative aldouronate transport system permease protein
MKPMGVFSMKRMTRGERAFSVVNVLFLTFYACLVLVPALYVLKRSFDVGAQGQLALTLIPREPSLFYYRMVLKDASIWRPFLNSIILTALGTLVSLSFEAMGAYALSRRELPGNKFFIYMLIVTMMFSGGIIPSYLLVRGLHLIDKFPWVLIIPSAFSAWNLILIRNYYFSIPESLRESAHMDGAPEFTIFSRIIFPLSMPVIAAVGLFTGISYWNTFFSAIIYINSPQKYTFAVKLREILALQMEMETQFEKMAMGQDLMLKNLNMEGLYSAIIVISIIPILIIYPFLSKHFNKGILVGSIKG